jgi:hypothetical protein
MPNSVPSRPSLVVVLALAVGFAVAHTQSPLFYSNQNQYLLHGLAAAGYGHLDHDWLATTRDPTPLFSAGVALAYSWAGLWSLQAVYFGLLVGYFLAAWWLVRAVPGLSATNRAAISFAAVFTVAHAAIFRLASVWLTGTDYPWNFQAGVAGQYVLGPGLQPSVFGVLLVASVAAFANNRPLLAAGMGAFAAILHPTYLLPAALLTVGIMIGLSTVGRWRIAVSAGGLALVIVTPVVAYSLATFPMDDTGSFAESQRILAEVRIPHHSVVARWFDLVAGLQVAWIAVGIGAVRKTRLFLPLLVPAVGAVALTLMQVATHNHTLALLFPWRISSVLVPISTAILTAKLDARFSESRFWTWLSVGVFIGSVLGGVAVTVLGLGYRMNEAEQPLLEYIHEHVATGDVYLIPTRIPPVGAGRGSVSTSFTPPPRPKPGSNLIPVDLQRFRLATGAPIFVDFKSVPYAHTEVLEWFRRVQLVEAWYGEKDWDGAGIHAQLVSEGITHVVIPRHEPITASFLTPIYEDETYAVYRVHAKESNR